MSLKVCNQFLEVRNVSAALGDGFERDVHFLAIALLADRHLAGLH